MAKMTKLVASISAKTSGYVRALQKARKENTKLATSYKKLKRTSKDFSRSMRGYMSVLAAGGLGKAVLNTGMEFEKIQRIMDFATGSAGKSSEAMGKLKVVTEDLGLHFLTTAEAFAKFNGVAKTSIIAGKQAEDAFLGVAVASSALGLSVDDQRGVFKALEQMMSKGTVQAEELRGQLGERLPGALPYAAKALGVTTRELNKMLEMGQVLAEDMIPKLSRVLREELGAAAVVASMQTQAALSRLSNSWDNLKNKLFDSDTVISASKGIAKALDTMAGGFDLAIPSVSELKSQIKQLSNAMNGIKDTEVAKKEKPDDLFSRQSMQIRKEIKEIEDRSDNWLTDIFGKSEKQVESLTSKLYTQLDLLKQRNDLIAEETRISAEKQQNIKFSQADGEVGQQFEKFTDKFTDKLPEEQKLEELEQWFITFKAKLAKTNTEAEQYILDLNEGTEKYSQVRKELMHQIVDKQIDADNKLFDKQKFDMNLGGLVKNFKGAMGEMKDEMKTTNRTIKDEMKDAVGSMSDGFVDFVVNGKASFSDFTRSILIDIAKILAKQALMTVFGSMFGNGGAFDGGKQTFANGGSFKNGTQKFAKGGVLDTGAEKFANGGVFNNSIKKFANGGVFNNSIKKFANGGVFNNTVEKFANGGIFNKTVHAFAGGGIVSSPTNFPMANGIGLMGEAGPEAIMPLKRDSKGVLGVKADLSALSNGGGGGTVINQTVNVDATNSNISEEKLTQAVEQGASQGFEMVLDDINRGGVIPKALG